MVPKAILAVRLRHPGGDAEGVVLVAGAALTGEATTPKGWINLCDGRLSGRDIPPVERPEVHPPSKFPANEAQPRDARVCGFRDRSLNVEVKD